MSFSLDELTLVTNDDTDDRSVEEGDPLYDIEVGDVTSFRDIEFQSEEMKHLLKLECPPDDDKYATKASYSANHMFPTWIINNEDWQSTEAKNKENQISDILQTPFNQRSQEQTSTLIHWLMSVWETANLMGFKRCGAMTKVFHFLTYESGENIITEGERGLTFYIVISGQCAVHKEGIGIVAGLQKGQSFGELALTEGKDLRSATVRAVSRVELLRLHKVDYDHFVKDIQLAERRENLQVLRSCKLFENWSRAKIQKMVTTCLRKSYDVGEYIFHQGDIPDNIYFIIEGTIVIIKEIHIVVRNRWPTDVREWDGVSKTKVKPHTVTELTRGSYFGELSIIKNKNRTASAKAKTRCTLLCLDKLEFVHLLRSGKTMETISHFVGDYEDDRSILDRVVDLKGGPSTTAQLNEYVKTADDFGSPLRPYSSPTPGDRGSPGGGGGSGSPTRHKILRIPTGVFEKTGPNHAIEFLKSGDHEQKESSSPLPSSPPRRKPTVVYDPGVARKTMITRANAAKFAGISKSVAKFKEIRDKVNKNKMPSVVKFRRQLQAAAEATQANRPQGIGGPGYTTNGPAITIPISGGGVGGGGGGKNKGAVATIPIVIDARHGGKGRGPRPLPLQQHQPVMVEAGHEFMRHVMEDVIKANRKLKYFKNQANQDLGLPSTIAPGGLKIGEVATHKSLRFSHPLSASPSTAAAHKTGESHHNHDHETQKRTFYLSQEYPSRGESASSVLESRGGGRLSRGSSNNPILQFPETSQSQPILTSIDSVVLKTASGRNIKSKEARDIEKFIGAAVNGKPRPTKEVHYRNSRSLSPLNSDSSLPEGFGVFSDHQQLSLK